MGVFFIYWFCFVCFIPFLEKILAHQKRKGSSGTEKSRKKSALTSSSTNASGSSKSRPTTTTTSGASGTNTTKNVQRNLPPPPAGFVRSGQKPTSNELQQQRETLDRREAARKSEFLEAMKEMEEAGLVTERGLGAGLVK